MRLRIEFGVFWFGADSWVYGKLYGHNCKEDRADLEEDPKP